MTIQQPARAALSPIIARDLDDVGDQIATLIVDRAARAGRRPFLLGCPSGRTGQPVYRALARRAAAGADVSTLVLVLMDEYLVRAPTGSLRVVDPEESYSCVGFARREILQPLRDACALAGTTAPEQVWFPTPQEPGSYDAQIDSAGGVDVFLLATGASDGHIALNQPGTDRSTRTHVALLGEATRRDNMGTFPEFTDLDLVPTHGVTVGVDTIAALSHEVVMIVTGAHKSVAFDRLMRAQGYDASWPATITTECRNPTLIADPAAAGRSSITTS